MLVLLCWSVVALVCCRVALWCCCVVVLLRRLLSWLCCVVLFLNWFVSKSVQVCWFVGYCWCGVSSYCCVVGLRVSACVAALLRGCVVLWCCNGVVWLVCRCDDALFCQFVVLLICCAADLLCCCFAVVRFVWFVA